MVMLETHCRLTAEVGDSPVQLPTNTQQKPLETSPASHRHVAAAAQSVRVLVMHNHATRQRA